ncbi:polycystin-1-like protein 1 [Ochotona princeps]|uniref:polycystin-1-like protein 1 n=1 Tax=Ochotona princeps TaxID=9978 RepID=UPI002714910E|nr:polycystin-1-like protein 1 [Ochotona princeps]
MLCSLTCPAGTVPTRGTGEAMNSSTCCFLETDAPASPVLGLRVHTPSGAALCLLVAFGAAAGCGTRPHKVTEAASVTAHHQDARGVYSLRALVANDFRGAEVAFGPYFVEVGSEAVTVFVNASSVRAEEALASAGSYMDREGAGVTHRLPFASAYSVSFVSWARTGGCLAWHSIPVGYRIASVSVHTNGTVFATDMEVTFEAVTTEPTPLEFMWLFGNDPPVRTASRSIKRRLRKPQGYQVTVEASSRFGSVVSEAHLIKVQERIVANRLLSTTSALVNTSVAFECRISFGTEVSYHWDFGDGTVSLGSSSCSHVYHREGEFTVEVLAVNMVSTATLRKQLFIVRRPCRPPPVKNLGPPKVQVWRSQPLRLGVTFEAAVLCDISRGLAYTWIFLDAEGSRVRLPAAVDTHRQTIELPGYTLLSGNYTALAKVQIQGSVVYSNYCVGVEVRPRAPVSVIAEGTHLFVPRAASAPLVLRGSQSYDPDHPGAVLRFHWSCTAASSPGQPCLEDSARSQVDMASPTLAFSARWLSTCCDQFLVTLVVSSGGQNSLKAQVFLSTRQDPSFRFVHLSWVSFKASAVNQNTELSLQAACEGCGDLQDLTFSWELFLVNATEDRRLAVPACSAVGMLGVSALGASWESSEPSSLSTEPSAAGPDSGTSVHLPWAPSPLPQGPPALSATWSTSLESTVGTHQTPAAVPGEDLDEGPLGLEVDSWDGGIPTRSPDERSWSSPYPDFEAYYGDIEEAEPSRGRQPGSASPPESGASLDEEGSPGEGDSLVDPFLSSSRAQPTLLVDWPKTPVSRAVFQGYTSSGITGPAVTIKPYSLSSGETYVLQASVATKHGLLGKAQLYLTVNQAPQHVTCQVQPHQGLEAHTLFSVFCMSGEPDFEYEFSYQIGDTPRHILYHGRDTQYYFALPAGEPMDSYQVMVSAEITDGRGSKAQPCAVAVTVLPQYRGMDCPGEDLYNSSLKSLSTLQLMGSHMEARNYITMFTRILSRLTTEDRNASCGQWSLIQDALISSLCAFTSSDQEELMASVLMLRDLVGLPRRLSSTSMLLILRYAQGLLARSRLPAGLVVSRGLRLELVQLLSTVWDASGQEGAMVAQAHVQEEGMELASALLLGCLSLPQERELRVSARQVEFLTMLHYSLQRSVHSLGPIRVYLPGDLAGPRATWEETRSPCYISQLVLFRKNPHPWGGHAPGQVGEAVGLTLHACSGRRPIRRHRLASPVTVEFGEDGGSDGQGNRMPFVLLRDEVNVHEFALGLSGDARETLQMRVEFSKPASRAFPVLLLVRFSERPTPSAFLVKQTHLWEERTLQIYIPAAAWKESQVGFLSLLDADYDKRTPNKHLAEAVHYTVRFQWLRCLLWDEGEWESSRSSPEPGTSPDTVSCSYDRLALFSLLRRTLSASLGVSRVSELRSHPQNLVPGVCVAVLVVLYGLLAVKSRLVDCREKKKAGCVFLQGSVPPGHQLYAIVVDTGFRSPARFSSKVYIILCFEDGCSPTRELHCPERPLFERNSRHTFMLSAPARLGTLQRVRLWHDSRGPAPSWFLSHMMVKELQSGRAWFFPAQCWLAADRGNGRVDRELTCLHQGFGVCKLFYATCTEYLEDFHVWLSVYSRPSSSGLLHTPRLAVCFCLLCMHMCLTALATTHGGSQLSAGPTDLTFRAFRLGLLCSLLASPGAQLLSLLFRLSKEPLGPPEAAAHTPLGAQMEGAQGPGETPGDPELHQHPASAILERDGARRKATSRPGTARPPWEPEALGAAQGPGGSWRPSWTAWAICSVASLACALATAILGYRFEPAQCVWWLHLLFLSVVCCCFITQPLMICVVALSHAWKRRDDSHFFAESLHKATRNLDSGLKGCSRTHDSLPGSPCCAGSAGHIAEVLAARQRARRLRWVRPPSRAQLKVTRERTKRESRTWAALRDVTVLALRLLLLLCVMSGRSSWDAGSLNQAVRKWFTRSPVHAWDSLQSVDGWWDWSLAVLLDGLHTAGPSMAAQPGALGGTCHLLGTPVIRQRSAAPHGLCKPLRLSAAMFEDTPSTQNPQVEGPQSGNGSHGGLVGCVHSLGRTRGEVQAALSGLRASRWIDHSTRSVSVCFTLFHTPSRLFTSVSLGVEILPSGALVPSSQVDSVSILRGDSVLGHCLMLSELASLALSLAHLCFQLCAMVDKGVLNYWRKPRNWLELAVTGTGFACHLATGHLATLAGEAADQFHKGFYREFVDLGSVVWWDQRVRWMQGALSFLLLWTSLALLGRLVLPASLSLVLGHTLSRARAHAPLLAGILLLAAHAGITRRWQLLSTWAPASSAWAGALPGLLFRFPGRSRAHLPPALSQSNPQATACSCLVLFTVLATLCFGVVSTHPHTRYHLDEFANLVDELLMKVEGLSSSLHLPPLERPRPSAESRAEDRPLGGGPSPYQMAGAHLRQ